MKGKSIALVLSSVFVFVSTAECQKNNWAERIDRAYHKGDTDLALIISDECIEELLDKALQIQEAIEKETLTLPIGFLDEGKRAVAKTYPELDGVATAYFYKGLSHYENDDKRAALEMLKKAEQFPGGRCLASGGWFWSPANLASHIREDLSFYKKPPYEIYLILSWNAFHEKNFDLAISFSDQCINEFFVLALRMEKRLKNKKVELVRRVRGPTEEQKASIFKNRILNFVATCFYIKAWSLENTNRIDEALASYDAAIRLTYSRSWDQRADLFWSIPDAAKDRVKLIEAKRPR